MNEATIAIKNKVTAIQEDKELEVEEPESQMDWKSIWKPLGIIAGVFLAFFWLPIDSSRFTGAVIISCIGKVVRPGTCAAVSGTGLFHRRCHFGFRVPGGGDEIPGGRRQ